MPNYYAYPYKGQATAKLCNLHSYAFRTFGSL